MSNTFRNTLGFVTSESQEMWFLRDRLKLLTSINFHAAIMSDVVQQVGGENILDACLAVKLLKETIEALPNIVRWIKDHPVTEF